MLHCVLAAKIMIMSARAKTLAILALLGSMLSSALAADSVQIDLDRRFADTVHPFLETYCFTCHGKEKQKGQLDFRPYSTTAAVITDYRRWETVLEKLKAEEMPPDEAKQHPAKQQRAAVIDWIQSIRKHEAERNAGDPGPVLARRLSNAEYDYTIRDLTGVDIRPTREFPVDPANEAGFDNSGESLLMSPALLKKYLDAARHVSDFLVLKPDGFAFAPHPVIAETDRDKYTVNRIIQFYQRQSTNYAGYFMSAWRFKNRAALGRAKTTLRDVAVEDKTSPQYLATVWSVLAGQPEKTGPIAALQAMWRELPAPDAAGAPPEGVRSGCARMCDFIIDLRQKIEPEIPNLTVRRIHEGSQPLVLWKDRQYATNRMHYLGGALKIDSPALLAGHSITSAAAARAMTIPTDSAEIESYEASFNRFCPLFPDAFFVSERARIYLDPKEEKNLKGRFLSAGFHSMMGYFRDDEPLYELVLDAQGRRELDTLWHELDFITSAPMRQHQNFVWFERGESSFLRGPEFDFARAEDKDITSEAKIKRLAEVYVAKAAKAAGTNTLAVEVIKDFFERVSANVRWVEKARVDAEPSHLLALQDFAARAYRRPLSNEERAELASFYRSLREQDGLSHEDAVRDTVVSVLMSPYFCYRMNRIEVGQGVRPLSDYELASRLSYFLWSSMPDQPLLTAAEQGKLHRPEVLAAQVRRMMQDERIRGLATEFGGNWLDFRRFEEINSVDRERFKTFNNELREAMFQEPLHFIMDVVQQDRSVLDFLYAKHTFVNPVLARHYGMDGLAFHSNEWVLVDDARRYERGGLLPMSVFLTKNAPGLRTSPVKRGNWVIKRLLGEQVPAPPATVPELPNDETKLGTLTLRETLARHRQDKACAGCHQRFDAIGLVFEGYGPVGELRTKDFGGRPVETHATFPDGSEGDGLEGVLNYIHQKRQDEFLDNLCRKMLVYALGRGLMLSDDSILHELRAKLDHHGYRFDDLIETIVTSPQFLNKRGEPGLAQK